MITYLVERTEIRGQDECWLWRMSVGGHGYGQAWDGTTVRTAHSLWWEAVTGERLRGNQPEDLTLHHTCFVKRCCNPNHLQAITNRENARMNGKVRGTHCYRGHPYDRRDRSGRPVCLTCRRPA
jgi:hypothetical protein